MNAGFEGEVVLVGGFTGRACAVAVPQRAVAISDDDLVPPDVVQTG